MDNKIRCQSCGMPLVPEIGNAGTNSDGSENPEFCFFCFAGGKYTNPNQTMDEMILSSIENMTSDLRMPVEQATELANSFIPKLRRWKTN